MYIIILKEKQEIIAIGRKWSATYTKLTKTALLKLEMTEVSVSTKAICRILCFN